MKRTTDFLADPVSSFVTCHYCWYYSVTLLIVECVLCCLLCDGRLHSDMKDSWARRQDAQVSALVLPAGLCQVTSSNWASPPSSLTGETCRWSLPVALFKSKFLDSQLPFRDHMKCPLKGNDSDKIREWPTCKVYFLLTLKSAVFYHNLLY